MAPVALPIFTSGACGATVFHQRRLRRPIPRVFFLGLLGCAQVFFAIQKDFIPGFSGIGGRRLCCGTTIHCPFYHSVIGFWGLKIYHFLTTFYHFFYHFLPLFTTFYHFFTTPSGLQKSPDVPHHRFLQLSSIFTTFEHFLTTFYRPRKYGQILPLFTTFYHFLPLFSSRQNPKFTTFLPLFYHFFYHLVKRAVYAVYTKNLVERTLADVFLGMLLLMLVLLLFLCSRAT